jgi:hypothetical protein
MDEHIDEARAYVKGLKKIQKTIKEGENLEISEIRYADIVSYFQEKLMILLNKSNI